MPRKLPRNYKKEYKDYHGSPKQKENRSSRNKAVRKLKREGKARIDGKEVDHKDGNPRNNSKGNLRAVKRKTNRRKK